MNIILGKKYYDKITNFTGMATGYCTYISGCNQVCLTPTIGEDGKMRDSAWFDEQRLVACDVEDVLELNNTKSNGFGDPAPLYR